MQNVSFFKRTIYYYLGVMLRIIHWTDTHKILGIRLSSLIRLISLLLPIAIWIGQWDRMFIIIGVVIFLWVQVTYWRARKMGYYRFVADSSDIMASGEVAPLRKKNHIDVFASGTFSLKDWEKNVVLKPAQYWQVPLGDHAVMVEHEPGRYLYQFFSANTMQEIKCGWLLYGSHPRPALSVSFFSSWGPEFNDDTVSLLRRNNNSSPRKSRVIYLSFESDDQEKAVWQNLIFDARRVRS